MLRLETLTQVLPKDLSDTIEDFIEDKAFKMEIVKNADNETWDFTAYFLKD